MSKILNIKTFSYLPLIGLSILPGTSLLAAPPIAYDSWSIDKNGQLSASCPSTFTCSNATTAAGMFQQTLISPDGKRFVQTIVHDNDPYQGAMSAETFVSIDPNLNSSIGNGGISAKQSISADGKLGDYESTVILNLGWASSDKESEILIDATLFGSGKEKRGKSQGTYYEHFRFEGERDVNGNDLGGLTVIRSELGASKDRKQQAWQVFETRIASGERVANAGAISTTNDTVPEMWSGRRGRGNVNINEKDFMGSSDPTPVDNYAKAPKTDPNPGPNIGGTAGEGSGGRPISGGAIAQNAPFGSYNYDPTGDTEGGNFQIAGNYEGTVNWHVGDKIQTVYIGQDIGRGVTAFSFQAFDNLSDAAGAAAIRRLQDTTPTVWTVDPFGPMTGMRSDGFELITPKVSGKM